MTTERVYLDKTKFLGDYSVLYCGPWVTTVSELTAEAKDLYLHIKYGPVARTFGAKLTLRWANGQKILFSHPLGRVATIKPKSLSLGFATPENILYLLSMAQKKLDKTLETDVVKLTIEFDEEEDELTILKKLNKRKEESLGRKNKEPVVGESKIAYLHQR